MLRVQLNNIFINALLDTGASCSVIDRGSLETFCSVDEMNNTTHNLMDASGNNMDIIGSVELLVQFDGASLMQNFKVLGSKTYKHVLLGRDFLAKFASVEFDCQNNAVKLGKAWLKCESVTDKVPVTTQEKTLLSPRSESLVNVTCKKSLGMITADYEPVEIQGLYGVYATRCRVIPNLEGVFQISLLNVTTDEIVLNAKKHVGHLFHAAKSVAVLDEQTQTSIDPSSIVFGPELSDHDKSQLRSLISEFSDVFASNPKKPTLVKHMEHHIVTNDAQPVCNKPHSIPYAWNKEINVQSQQMLQNEIIRPSSSPWNAPVILVKKKDESMRFVCDFRGLNDVTKKDSYPLPHIRDVIDKMQGTRYWTTLDAASAYWSMPLAEEDKEKTAFSVPRGKYEFTVTPYGLCNAGASYQRMMDISLAGLPSDRILAYMDDIAIFSTSFNDHIQDLRNIFQRLRFSGISLKLSKCVFASEQVNFLGFRFLDRALHLKIDSPMLLLHTRYQPPRNK